MADGQRLLDVIDDPNALESFLGALTADSELLPSETVDNVVASLARTFTEEYEVDSPNDTLFDSLEPSNNLTDRHFTDISQSYVPSDFESVTHSICSDTDGYFSAVTSQGSESTGSNSLQPPHLDASFSTATTPSFEDSSSNNTEKDGAINTAFSSIEESASSSTSSQQQQQQLPISTTITINNPTTTTNVNCDSTTNSDSSSFVLIPTSTITSSSSSTSSFNSSQNIQQQLTHIPSLSSSNINNSNNNLPINSNNNSIISSNNSNLSTTNTTCNDSNIDSNDNSNNLISIKGESNSSSIVVNDSSSSTLQSQNLQEQTQQSSSKVDDKKDVSDNINSNTNIQGGGALETKEKLIEQAATTNTSTNPTTISISTASSNIIKSSSSSSGGVGNNKQQQQTANIIVRRTSIPTSESCSNVSNITANQLQVQIQKQQQQQQQQHFQLIQPQQVPQSAPALVATTASQQLMQIQPSNQQFIMDGSHQLIGGSTFGTSGLTLVATGGGNNQTYTVVPATQFLSANTIMQPQIQQIKNQNGTFFQTTPIVAPNMTTQQPQQSQQPTQQIIRAKQPVQLLPKPVPNSSVVTTTSVSSLPSPAASSVSSASVISSTTTNVSTTGQTTSNIIIGGNGNPSGSGGGGMGHQIIQQVQSNVVTSAVPTITSISSQPTLTIGAGGQVMATGVGNLSTMAPQQQHQLTGTLVVNQFGQPMLLPTAAGQSGAYQFIVRQPQPQQQVLTIQQAPQANPTQTINAQTVGGKQQPIVRYLSQISQNQAQTVQIQPIQTPTGIAYAIVGRSSFPQQTIATSTAQSTTTQYGQIHTLDSSTHSASTVSSTTNALLNQNVTPIQQQSISNLIPNPNINNSAAVQQQQQQQQQQKLIQTTPTQINKSQNNSFHITPKQNNSSNLNKSQSNDQFDEGPPKKKPKKASKKKVVTLDLTDILKQSGIMDEDLQDFTGFDSSFSNDSSTQINQSIGQNDLHTQLTSTPSPSNTAIKPNGMVVNTSGGLPVNALPPVSVLNKKPPPPPPPPPSKSTPKKAPNKNTNNNNNNSSNNNNSNNNKRKKTNEKTVPVINTPIKENKNISKICQIVATKSSPKNVEVNKPTTPSPTPKTTPNKKKSTPKSNKSSAKQDTTTKVITATKSTPASKPTTVNSALNQNAINSVMTNSPAINNNLSNSINSVASNAANNTPTIPTTGTGGQRIIQTIQLSPQNQQLLMNIQVQIQRLYSIKNRNETEQTALQKLIVLQQQVIATGTPVPNYVPNAAHLNNNLTQQTNNKILTNNIVNPPTTAYSTAVASSTPVTTNSNQPTSIKIEIMKDQTNSPAGQTKSNNLSTKTTPPERKVIAIKREVTETNNSNILNKKNIILLGNNTTNNNNNNNNLTLVEGAKKTENDKLIATKSSTKELSKQSSGGSDNKSHLQQLVLQQKLLEEKKRGEEQRLAAIKAEEETRAKWQKEQFEEFLKKDQEFFLNPDYQTPFVSKKDAVEKLMSYHICRDRNEMTFGEFDSNFSENAVFLLDKFSSMLKKYKTLILKESMREVNVSERVMLERFFVNDEKLSLESDRQLVRETGEILDLPTPPENWIPKIEDMVEKEIKELERDSIRDQQVQSAIDSIISFGNLDTTIPSDENEKVEYDAYGVPIPITNIGGSSSASSADIDIENAVRSILA